MIFPVTTLGPGNRIVLWTSGCSKHCEKCINPELWEKDSTRNIFVEELAKKIIKVFETDKVDGITITGGDPLEQKDDFLRLIDLLHPICQDILVYTGYTLSEIKELWQADEIKVLQENVGVLIDNQYVHELNDNCCPLRGSQNQEIYHFDESLREIYDTYREDNGRKLQTFHYSSGAVSVGIHDRARY
jgi:anaerobic ribonucleoside-triphosphate reductase activating protein